MSKDMGFFVYLGYISGYVREIPGVYARRYMHRAYARADSALYLQRLLSPLIPSEKKTNNSCLPEFYSGGQLSLASSLIGRSLTPLAAPQNA